MQTLTPANAQGDNSPINYRFYLPSEESIVKGQIERTEARRLPLGRLWLYKTLWFFRWGDLKRLRIALVRHELAAKHAKQDRQMLKALTPEAKYYGRLLVQHLSRLGFANVEKYQGRRKIMGRIRFRQVVLDPERFFFQVLTSRRTSTGARSMLPWHVNARDLLDEKTTTHLSISLNRLVTSEFRPHKGLWFIVHVTKDMNSLPRRVSWHAMVDEMTPGRAELILGVGANRVVHLAPLDDRPHLLLAGSTGGGKSNSLNAMICAMIWHNTPATLKLALIDLKGGLEFEDYESIPHLVTDVISTQRGARDFLVQALALVKLRYKIMRAMPKPRPKSLSAFNARQTPDRRMQRLVIVVDELAELLIGGDKKLQGQIANLLIRIAQLGRAAGVHLILSTQRPQKEIIPTSISAQMTVKMSHRMGTKADSMTIFGSGEAAELDPVPGRAVYKVGWQPHIVQPPAVVPEIIGAATARAKQYAPAPLQLPDLPVAERIIADDSPDNGPDYERDLITILEAAGGRLTLQLVMQLLGKNRADAGIWLNRVAGLSFEHGGLTYEVIQVGRGYRIAEASPEPEPEPEPAPAVVSSNGNRVEKWRVKRG